MTNLMPYPLIITIDGLDAAGKETVSRALAKRINTIKNTDRCVNFSFPRYFNESGKFIKSVLSNSEFLKLVPDDRKPYLISELFIANRHEFFTSMKDEFDAGGIYVFDRYSASNILYQGVGMTDFELNQLINYNKTLEYDVYKNYKPTYSFFLRVPYKVLRDRIKFRESLKSGEDNDNYEKDAFLKSVYHLSEYMLTNQDKIAVHDLFNYIIDAVEPNNMRLYTVDELVDQMIQVLVEEGILVLPKVENPQQSMNEYIPEEATINKEEVKDNADD
ncbi:MAG: hypothetical protein SPF22_08310 [Candidatus Onthovivens sp.]|nr:hypothetical protein [Candidatus Onthovivens sp.]